MCLFVGWKNKVLLQCTFLILISKIVIAVNSFYKIKYTNYSFVLSLRKIEIWWQIFNQIYHTFQMCDCLSNLSTNLKFYFTYDIFNLLVWVINKTKQNQTKANKKMTKYTWHLLVVEIIISPRSTLDIIYICHLCTDHLAYVISQRWLIEYRI